MLNGPGSADLITTEALVHQNDFIIDVMTYGLSLKTWVAESAVLQEYICLYLWRR
jgi:hypothetical protein